MKSKIFILAGVLCTLGMMGANASDCIGDGCDIAPIQKPTPLPMAAPVVEEYECIDCDQPSTLAVYGPDQYFVTPPTPKSVNLISVKPVEPDNRRPLWDGMTQKYTQKHFDKTVDWRDGVPIWDDSISNYRDKDFSDWFLDPTIEPVIVEEYVTRDEVMNAVSDLLEPMRPRDDLWSSTKYAAQDMTAVVEQTFDNVRIIEITDGCPFETEAECAIWRRKPMVRETVSPRSPTIRVEKMDEFLNAACANPRITANTTVAAPLLDRYKMLMKSARSCCTDGMAYSLKRAGATDGLVYKFMSDDANFYGIGDRCLMMTDDDFDTKYPNTATAAVAADVRNGCLCRGRQWFGAMLAPFQDAYSASPEFAAEKFNYTYTDGLQREITVSINTDVKNVLNQLELCP